MAGQELEGKCSCGGELIFDGGRRRSSYRFELWRCSLCGLPKEIMIDNPFRNEFPMLGNISIKILDLNSKREHTFGFDSPSTILFCRNQKCSNPGLFLNPKIHEMIEKKIKHLEYYEYCSGYESSPKEFRKKPCEEEWKVTIDIEF